ncbi:MAG: M20/M25/M40 family metallo-hydrolase [Polyangiaceae bacterium]|nr:M20/M25/M40 family metallo-hydrolase [Polyangiaceae bacterium]
MSSHPSNDPVAILTELVSFRTDLADGNERALADRLAVLLRERGPDSVTVGDVPRGDGKAASYVYARFGSPKLLVNAHLDTVAPNASWASNPFSAVVHDERLCALGAADTKGAMAAILAALAEKKPTNTGILLSGDEEYSGVVMRAFVKSPLREGLTHAIVCEPTNLHLGVRHRGLIAFEVEVTGPGGHSSLADATPAPLVTLAKVALALDGWAKRHSLLGPPGFQGTCMNVAQMSGGTAFNVIPTHARLLVSLRPAPGTKAPAICAELEALVGSIEPLARVIFIRNNAPFATQNIVAFERLLGPCAHPPIDLGFWTEAAVLAASGIDAVVVGPGNIAQAHGPGEWVSLGELAQARDLFRSIF